LSETTITIILVLLLIGALGLNIFVKFRRLKKTPLGRAASILIDINRNEKFMENFSYHHGIGRMRTGAWKKNKDKVDYLPQELRMKLAQLFEMSEQVNERIDAARKFKSDSYMAGIDLSKLKAPLATSKQQLQDWLQENMQNPEYQPKRRRGLFG
jgi:hypothetical protein